MKVSHYSNMGRIEAKIPARTVAFTDKKYRAMMVLAGRSRRFSSKQGYTVAANKQNNAGVAILLARLYFPGVIFAPERRGGSLEISRFIEKKGDNWFLNLHAMSRSEAFRHLFHEDFAVYWDEAKARARYGTPDVVRFCIDIENDRFWASFSKMLEVTSSGISQDDIREMFLEKLKFYGKPIWEACDFSSVTSKQPHNLYTAFRYFAYMTYNLLRFGLNKSGASGGRSMGEFLKAGIKVMHEIIEMVISEMTEAEIKKQTYFFKLATKRMPIRSELDTEDELKINWLSARSIFAGRTFEQVPKGTSEYDLKTQGDFERQLRSGLNHFRYKTIQSDNFDLYDESDRKDINNYLEILGQNNEKRTFLEKVKFLFEHISNASRFTEDQRARIIGWYNKQYLIELDAPSPDGEGGSLSAHKYVESNIDLPDIDFFKEEFKHQLAEQKLTEFLGRVSRYLGVNPPKKNSAGLFKMSDYYKDRLFSEFCELEGITPDNNLKKFFMERIQMIIDTINNNRGKV